MMQQPARPRMHRGRWITQGQHDAVGSERRAPRDLHEERFVADRPLDPRHLAENTLEHHPGRCRAFRLVQHFLQITAVHRPRHEILGIRIGVGLADVAQEMQRIARLDR
jgi:hypothetical protein